MRHLLSATIALSLLTIPVLAQAPSEQNPSSTQSTTETPRRLSINVIISDPSDLKVSSGDRVLSGQLIADRTAERKRLESQKAQLTLNLERIQSATITPPLPPEAVPAIADLPPADYLEEESAVAIAQLNHDAKAKELELLAQVPELEPIILEHESAELKELEQRLRLEQGRLNKSRQERGYEEYQHSITKARRIEELNTAQSFYQQQWANYEENVRLKDFQVAQSLLKLNEIDNAIASLSTVRAPYDGVVRNIKWLEQNAAGLLSAEVTIIIDSPDRDRPDPLQPVYGPPLPE